LIAPAPLGAAAVVAAGVAAVAIVGEAAAAAVVGAAAAGAVVGAAAGVLAGADEEQATTTAPTALVANAARIERRLRRVGASFESDAIEIPPIRADPVREDGLSPAR